MGEVIRFPDETGNARGGRYVDASTEPAIVIILPVIRVERDPDGSSNRIPATHRAAAAVAAWRAEL